MNKSHSIVPQEQRDLLLQEVVVKHSQIIDASQKLGIKYSTAKSIVQHNTYTLKQRPGPSAHKTTPEIIEAARILRSDPKETLESIAYKIKRDFGVSLSIGRISQITQDVPYRAKAYYTMMREKIPPPIVFNFPLPFKKDPPPLPAKTENVVK